MASALDTLISLGSGINGYSPQNAAKKQRMHSYGRAFLRRLAADLGLRTGTFDVRSNKGGIAVSGEATLHAERIYVQISESCIGRSGGLTVLFRRCEGCKDYCGRRNHMISMTEVKADYLSFLASVRNAMQED